MVPSSIWLRELRALLGELTCPVLWIGPETRAGVGAALHHAGRMFGVRELCQVSLFEPLLPDLRGALLEVAEAEVRH